MASVDLVQGNSPLERLPHEILERVAGFAALPFAADDPHPPVLLPLLLTSRTLYARLCPNNNRHLIVNFFLATFDISALERRFGDHRLTHANLAAECIRRCSVLRRIRKASTGAWNEPTYPFLEDLWSVYLMLLEDDGLNSALLNRYAGAVDWLWTTIRALLSQPSSAEGRAGRVQQFSEPMWYGHGKGETEHAGLTLWSLWYLIGHARDPLPFTHPLLLDIDRFAIPGIQYPALYFPPTHWQLPIYVVSPTHLPEHTPARAAPDIHHPLHAFAVAMARHADSLTTPLSFATRTTPPARRLPFPYFPPEDACNTRRMLRAPPLLSAVTLLRAARFIDALRAQHAVHLPPAGLAVAAAAAFDAYDSPAAPQGTLVQAADWGGDVTFCSPHIGYVPPSAPAQHLINAFFARVGLGTGAPPRAALPHDDANEQEEEDEPSALRDDEWNRAVQCVRVVDCPGLDEAAHAELDERAGQVLAPGALAGVWEGLFCGSDIRPPGAPEAPRLPWRPMGMRLREYHCLDPREMLPPGWDDEWTAPAPAGGDAAIAEHDHSDGSDEEDDGMEDEGEDEDAGGDEEDADDAQAEALIGNGARNAWFPRGIKLVERGDTLEATDPRTGRTHRYARFHPGARAPYAPSWMRRLRKGTHVHAAPSGEFVEMGGSGVHDVLLVGETPPSGALWGKYAFVGRTRAWDGLVNLLSYPIDTNGLQPRSGRNLFSGYLHACPPGSPREYNLVGRWRETGTVGGLARLGYEGSFVVTR